MSSSLLEYKLRQGRNLLTLKDSSLPSWEAPGPSPIFWFWTLWGLRSVFPVGVVAGFSSLLSALCSLQWIILIRTSQCTAPGFSPDNDPRETDDKFWHQGCSHYHLLWARPCSRHCRHSSGQTDTILSCGVYLLGVKRGHYITKQMRPWQSVISALKKMRQGLE